MPGYEAPWSVLLRNKMAERFASVSEDELCEKCTRLLPKKIFKGPSELNAENLGAQHTQCMK